MTNDTMKLLSRFSLLTLTFTLAATAALADIASSAVRTKIAGFDLIAYKTGVKDVVYLRGALPAGDNKAPADHPYLPTLVGDMLDRGTTLHDKAWITEQLDAVGAAISFSVNTGVLEFNARCLAKDVPLVVTLLAEQLRHPLFSAEELAKLKKQTIGNIRRSLENTGFRASDEFSRAAYPVGHPNRQATTEENIASVEKATVAELKAFHAAHYGPAHLTIIAVGDINVPQVEAELGRAFAGWTGGSAPLATAKATRRPTPRASTMSSWPTSRAWTSSSARPPACAMARPTTSPCAPAPPPSAARASPAASWPTPATKRASPTASIPTSPNDMFVDGDFRVTGNFAPEPARKRRRLHQAPAHRRMVFKTASPTTELARKKTGNSPARTRVALSTTEGMSQHDPRHRQPRQARTRLASTSIRREVNALTKDEVNTAIKKHLNPEKMLLIKAGTVPGAVAK
jgi:zinc protease